MEEFVEHLSFLGKMTSEMAALDKEFGIVTRFYTIARDNEVPIPAEELALYQTLTPSFQHLKVRESFEICFLGGAMGVSRYYTM